MVCHNIVSAEAFPKGQLKGYRCPKSPRKMNTTPRSCTPQHTDTVNNTNFNVLHGQMFLHDQVDNFCQYRHPDSFNYQGAAFFFSVPCDFADSDTSVCFKLLDHDAISAPAIMFGGAIPPAPCIAFFHVCSSSHTSPFSQLLLHPTSPFDQFFFRAL